MATAGGRWSGPICYATGPCRTVGRPRATLSRSGMHESRVRLSRNSARARSCRPAGNVTFNSEIRTATRTRPIALFVLRQVGRHSHSFIPSSRSCRGPDRSQPDFARDTPPQEFGGSSDETGPARCGEALHCRSRDSGSDTRLRRRLLSSPLPVHHHPRRCLRRVPMCPTRVPSVGSSGEQEIVRYQVCDENTVQPD